MRHAAGNKQYHCVSREPGLLNTLVWNSKRRELVAKWSAFGCRDQLNFTQYPTFLPLPDLSRQGDPLRSPVHIKAQTNLAMLIAALLLGPVSPLHE